MSSARRITRDSSSRPASRRSARMRSMPEAAYTPNEIMTIEAARRLKNGNVCFVGIGLPSAAANLARLTHAPEAVLIYESGTIRPQPAILPLSIGDGQLAEHDHTLVSLPENVRYT